MIKKINDQEITFRTPYPEGVTVEADSNSEASLENGILTAVFPITSDLQEEETTNAKIVGKKRKAPAVEASKPPKKLQKLQVEEDTGSKNKKGKKQQPKIEDPEDEEEMESPKESKQKKKFTTVCII